MQVRGSYKHGLERRRETTRATEKVGTLAPTESIYRRFLSKWMGFNDSEDIRERGRIVPVARKNSVRAHTASSPRLAVPRGVRIVAEHYGTRNPSLTWLSSHDITSKTYIIRFALTADEIRPSLNKGAYAADRL